MAIRKLAPADRPRLADLLRATKEFTADEVDVALELIDACLEGEADYEVLVADDAAGAVTGYVCFGHTSMTDATYDLYWIAVDATRKGKGIGRALVAAMESAIRARGGKQVRVETESSAAYDATRAFYDALGYERAGLFTDFYRAGVDLVTYRRAL